MAAQQSKAENLRWFLRDLPAITKTMANGTPAAGDRLASKPDALMSGKTQGGPAGAGSAGAKTTTYDFPPDDPEPTYRVEGVPGQTGEMMISDELNLLQHHIGDYWSNYMAGIQKFTNRMEFSSEQEARADVMGAVLKVAGKMALEHLFEKAAGDILWPIWQTVKPFVDAAVEELERAAKAGGEVKIVQFINGTIERISKAREKMRGAADQARAKFIEEFRRLAKEDSLKGVAKDGVIVGKAAKAILDVRAGVKAFKNAIPPAAAFQQEFTRAFAKTPGRTDAWTQGGREAGRLYFHVYVDPDGDIDEDETSDAWELVTLAPRPERVAASVAESLGEGKKPWQNDFTKAIRIRYEIEVTGPNYYEEAWVYFAENPDRFWLGGGKAADKVGKLWREPKIRARVLNTTQLEGSGK